MNIIRKHQKLIALILGVIILLGSIPLTMGWNKNNVSAMDNASSEDKRIASEISNTTGAKLEEIFRLKNNGRSWNEVLSTLKNKYSIGTSGDISSRDSLLLSSGLDEEFMAKLKKEGFSEQDITEVKLLEERVSFQLQEITDGSRESQVTNPTHSSQTTPANIEEPKLGLSSNNKDLDDISAYEELYKKIDIKNAVYFMLKLKADFGSYEKVFDEYIYSLQADLDLNEYIKDKKAYLKSKGEKQLLLNEQKVLTLEKIEEKSIEKTQQDNKNSASDVSTQENEKTSNSAASDSVTQDKSPLPDVPKPANEDVKPKNPTYEIMNEIKEINPIEN
jgi:hypothetical protein